MIDLDVKQQEAVSHTFGSLLVLAGPGSGKTATITNRAAWMIKKGVDPANLLLVTFSKKAANEMRARLSGMTDEAAAERASIHTFHALGDKIIKQFPESCERQHGYSILDEGDQRGLFVRVLRESMKVEKPGSLSYRDWLSAYNRLAQDGARAVESEHAEFFSKAMNQHAGIERQDQMTWLWHAFKQYEEAKKQQNVVDFNDLLILPATAMRRNEKMVKTLSDQYQMLTIDEAQDTGGVQYDMVRDIAKHHGNITVVGDDDQLIYSWRGASTSNLRRFVDDFDPKIVKLEQNYRSTTSIIKSARMHIRHNSQRMEKQPFSVRDENGRPQLGMYGDDRQMSRNIVAMLKSHHEEGTPWDEMAILYRKNRIGDMLEPALMEAGIPYDIQGGLKLTARKEVKLAVSLARLTNNCKDEMAFLALAKDIKGLGETGIEKHIKECKAQTDGSLLQPTMATKKTNVRDRMEELTAICETLKREGPSLLIPMLIDNWGLNDHFPQDKQEQIEIRCQRLQLFETWIKEAIASKDPDDNPWQVMQRVLLEDPEADLSEGKGVSLSTAHRAKGQEWKRVHIAGYSDGLMPMRNKQGEVADPEEERRISYVCMTRAADYLYLHHANRMFLGYETLEMELSPYVEEFIFDRMEMLQEIRKPEEPANSNIDGWLPNWARN
jgi:DNA helicase-2/ATP-dependent DNA helicase PcrA